MKKLLLLSLLISTFTHADFASQNKEALDFSTTGDVMATQNTLKAGIDPNNGGGLGIGSTPCGQADASGKYFCGGQAITPTDSPPETGYYNQAPSQLEDAGRTKSVTDDTASFQMNTAIAMPVGIVERDDPMLQFDAQNEAALTPLADTYSGCSTVKGGAGSSSGNTIKTCMKTGVPNITHCYRSWTGHCTWINQDPVEVSSGSKTLKKEKTLYTYNGSGVITGNANAYEFFHYDLTSQGTFTLKINKRMLNPESIFHVQYQMWVANKDNPWNYPPTLKINGTAVPQKWYTSGIGSKMYRIYATFYNIKDYLNDGDNVVELNVYGQPVEKERLLNLYNITECVQSISENFTCDADIAKTVAKPLVKTLCLDSSNPKWVDGQAIYKPDGCWQQDEQHGFVGTGLFTEDYQCKQYRADKCTVLKEECLAKHSEGWCTTAKMSFNCPTSTAQQTVEVCGDTLICPDGNCYDQVKEKGDATEDFKQAATYMELLKNAKDAFDPNNLSVFKGQYKECSVNKTLVGTDKCCIAGTGALNTVGQGCSINEETIATARNNKVVTNLGEWTECTKKILGVCINKVVHYPYCVWPSKLARMIQDQGMAQIGQPITTDCRGFKLNAPNEIQMVDFSKIDLSEYFSDVVDKLNATALPTPNALVNQTQSLVPAMADKLNERYKDYGR